MSEEAKTDRRKRQWKASSCPESAHTFVPELMKRTRRLQILSLEFFYERKTSQVLPPLRFYLHSWCQPLARWSVCASSHGHHFFPTGLLHGHRVFSQTPGVCRSAAQSPCAWTTGTGPLNAWGGWEVAPSEQLFPQGLSLLRLSDIVHLEWETQGCVCMLTPHSGTNTVGRSLASNILQTVTVICMELQILKEKNVTFLWLP